MVHDEISVKKGEILVIRFAQTARAENDVSAEEEEATSRECNSESLTACKSLGMPLFSQSPAALPSLCVCVDEMPRRSWSIDSIPAKFRKNPPVRSTE